MYGITLTDSRDQKKAENVIQRFTRQAIVNRGTFMYSERPVEAKVCMSCTATEGCPMGFKACPIDRAIQQTLVGFEALEYVHVKTRIVFPAP